MIDLSTETPIPLVDVRLPGRAGKHVHFCTVWRWITQGVRGPGGQRVRLDALRVGSRWVTSARALQDFAETLTPKWDDMSPAPRTQRQANRAARQSGERLRKQNA
jgi:hypothetical protein